MTLPTRGLLRKRLPVAIGGEGVADLPYDSWRRVRVDIALILAEPERETHEQ